MTVVTAPRDRYNLVWIIFFILGLGTLLPWNFFMTATQYFTNRLKEPGGNFSRNGTAQSGVDNRSRLEATFSNVMTLCAMVPLLIFTCLNSFIHQKIPQKVRILGGLTGILVIFLVTSAFVKLDMQPLPFYTLTMIKIVCINSFGAMLQGSVFGLVGMLPASYTTPVMSGQGLAGVFAAFSMICAILTGAELQDSAFGYFITACVVILLAIISYLMLPKMEFFQYYMESTSAHPVSDENKLDLMKIEDGEEKSQALSLRDEADKSKVSVLGIFKEIWVMALSVSFIFTVTIGVFPAVTVDAKTTLCDDGQWSVYFIPVSCFLLFNLMDWAGRSLTALCMWPGKDSKVLPILVVARLVFVPLFMLCNIQPRQHMPVVFKHDAWYILFMILFAFSNGYLASLCMCYGPKKVLGREAETAGTIMVFFLSLGLALGAAVSFAFRAMV